jgi:hypothetical protein
MQPAQQHVKLQLQLLITRLLHNLESAGFGQEMVNAFPFLKEYLETPPQLSIRELENRTTSHLPLLALQDAGLTPEAIDVLLLSGLVEEDVRFGSFFAALQDPLLARRPCLGSMGWLLSEAGAPPLDTWSAARTLMDAGMLLVDNPKDARADWVVRAPQSIWDGVRGRFAAPEGMSFEPSDGFPHLDDLILPPELHAQVRRLPQAEASAVVVRGMPHSGRRTMLGAIARSSGCNLLLCGVGHPQQAQVGVLAVLGNAIPVLRCQLAPGETKQVDKLPLYDGTAGVCMGRGGGLKGSLFDQAIALRLPMPDADQRRRFWQAADIPLPQDSLIELSRDWRLTGGMILRTAKLVQAHLAIDDRETLTRDDVRRTLQTLNQATLETLTTRLDPVQGWRCLILDEPTQQELNMLATRCRQRENLSEVAGVAFEAQLNDGVRAMFSGESGTGKTLAARTLGAELGRDVYRVDLAAVVNKYIGETERNLNEVFTAAEVSDVVLLLDEGDALMGRRTNVSSANDRYANLETNYLLQRLESFQGIVIITTNAAQNIDDAFARRMDVVIDFARPDATLRRRLWDIHLPAAHDINADTLEQVVDRCALSGGQICTAALYTTLLALHDETAPCEAHLLQAVEREYRKQGESYPLRRIATKRSKLQELRSFS